LIKRHTGPQTRIRADSAQIRQIVLNLVVNAWEAMGDTPGTITLTTGVEDCDDALLSRSRTTEKPTAGRYAFLEVADTGSGMDIFTLDRLFDPFFTTKFTGRGLGLPAALGIVQAHKGAITVESEAATGTRFRVYLPVPGVGQASTTGQKRSTSP
jgi:signal transduction histidine kinase